MAEKRMFTKKVTDDDNFMSLSSSAQALYLHLSMSADDDGFSNQVSISMFKAHASVQDLQALLEKRYIYQFENGVIVIKHWRMANALRKDRYTPTAFQDELAQLGVKDNGSYTWLPDGCQMVATRLPDGCHSIDKSRLGKVSIDKSRLLDGSKEPLSDSPAGKSNAIVAEVIDYLNEKAGTAYRANTKANATLILARYKEGATLEDFKSVIDKKVAEWKGDTRMEQYLRPKTLFAAQNFDSYLGAKVTPTKRVGANGIEYVVDANREDEFDGIF